MYAKLAQTTSSCDSAQEFTRVLADMREKFRERVPDEVEFSVPFIRLTYRSSYTRDRNLVRYVLTKLARHYGMPEEVDANALTIEHILPQSKGEETGDEFDVGAIGNLILISEEINGLVDNKDFSYKKNLFDKKHSVYMDEYLQKAKTWKVDDIGLRAVDLAKIGYNQIWKI